MYTFTDITLTHKKLYGTKHLLKLDQICEGCGSLKRNSHYENDRRKQLPNFINFQSLRFTFGNHNLFLKVSHVSRIQYTLNTLLSETIHWKPITVCSGVSKVTEPDNLTCKNVINKTIVKFINHEENFFFVPIPIQCYWAETEVKGKEYQYKMAGVPQIRDIFFLFTLLLGITVAQDDTCGADGE